MNNDIIDTLPAAERNDTAGSASGTERQPESGAEPSGISPEQSAGQPGTSPEPAASDDQTVTAPEPAASDDQTVTPAEPAASDDQTVTPAEPAAKEEPAENPVNGQEIGKPKKKSRTAVKVLLTVLIVLLALALLLAGAAFFTLRAMLKDDMPQAPGTVSASGTDIEALLTSSSRDILFENEVSVGAAPVNELLDMIRQTVNDSADNIRMDDLFCAFDGGKGTVYSRVYVDTVPVNGRDVRVGRTIPVSLGLDADFEDPCIVLTPSELRCGKVGVPEFVLKKLLETLSSAGTAAESGSAARIEDGKIYADISDLTDYASQVTGSEINKLMLDEDTFEEYRAVSGDGGIFRYIEDSADVKISGIGIAEGSLVIYTDVSMLCNRTHDRPNENVIAGDYFFFGSYPQSNDSPEPVKWLVLDVSDGKALAISETLLDCKLYNDQYIKTTWSECSLRKWLNSDFYDAAFSDSEKSVIETVKNSNPDNRITGASGGPDTEDKVFCLELDEAKNYGKEIDLRAVVTDYAISRGAETNSHFGIDGKDTGYWWLRSPGLDNSAAACVYPSGLCSNSGQYFMSLHDVCVRPVIEVSLSE